MECWGSGSIAYLIDMYAKYSPIDRPQQYTPGKGSDSAVFLSACECKMCYGFRVDKEEHLAYQF